MKYKVLTNASTATSAIWGSPSGPYGVARCVNWKDYGQVFTAIRWIK